MKVNVIMRWLLALALLGLVPLPMAVNAADISVTAASVVSISGTVETGTAGATITAGKVVYYDPTTYNWKLAQCDGTVTEAGQYGLAIALGGAGSGQPFLFQRNGVINPGGTAIVAGVYVVSATAGSIALTGDVTTTGYYRSVLGVALSASQIALQPYVSNTVLP